MTGPLLRYTLLRLVLFAAMLALLALTGVRGLLLLALAVLASGFVSLLLLRGTREQLSQAIVEDRRRRSAARARADAAPHAAPDAAPDAGPDDAVPRDPDNPRRTH